MVGIVSSKVSGSHNFRRRKRQRKQGCHLPNKAGSRNYSDADYVQFDGSQEVVGTGQAGSVTLEPE